MKKRTKASQTWRRGELMAELFLQELEPQFVAKSTISDLAFDFFIGFPNPNGGINTYAVEVKATEKPVRGKHFMKVDQYKLLANSNIPALLLVVDVKENEFYYAWPRDYREVSHLKNTVKIPVTHIDQNARAELVDRMAG